ncbi:30S ribosomal protein S20 [Alkalicaulis satelles]|uniref:Small ribosomal subunit protein bS20 n=1 Tax=Alkalicaulis satelles TaxID=2609175 RepID=A0A5M6ZCM0_9PROT|nr:30S ribosomal protein S20 [Alkalicaulis satelles]KAA5802429.1 30S ribosomal protein S20 [Alkalicaulis satelles]
MANTASAKKMVRKIERRTALNKARRSRMRTFVKKLELAVAAGDQDAAKTALRTAESEVMKAVSNGVIHKNTGSRKVSRMTARVKAMTAK